MFWGTLPSSRVKTPGIFDFCKESGFPKPEFELANGYVYLTIHFAKPLTPRLSGDRENDREDDREKPIVLTSRQQLLLSLMKENDKVTAKEIKTHFKESIATINRDITILKKANVLRHEGSDKDGRWIVLI